MSRKSQRSQGRQRQSQTSRTSQLQAPPQTRQQPKPQPQSQPELSYLPRSNKGLHKLGVWVLSVLIVAFLPFVIHTNALVIHGKQVTAGALFGRGELFIVSLAILADGGGEVFGLPDTDHWLRKVTLIFCAFSFIMVIPVAGAYGSIVLHSTDLDTLQVALWSPYVCLAAVAASFVCKLGASHLERMS